jgi:hypothetical protein
MRSNAGIRHLLAIIISFTGNFCFSQNNNSDTITAIKITGIFDKKIVSVGNYDAVQVYRFQDYCIALTDISQSLADSLNGKKIRVTGFLKVIVGKTFPAKTSNNGIIYEPYKEAARNFISDPKFTILE